MYKEVSDDFDYKSVVISGYDNCAERYHHEREKQHDPAMDFILDKLPTRSSVLDVGCGSGVPVCSTLTTRYEVEGIDISSKQIELARKNVPSAHFEHVDVLDYARNNDAFDAIVCFYALFHIPKQKHRDVLSRFYNWLRPNGYLIVTLAEDDEPGYTEDDFLT